MFYFKALRKKKKKNMNLTLNTGRKPDTVGLNMKSVTGVVGLIFHLSEVVS